MMNVDSFCLHFLQIFSFIDTPGLARLSCACRGLRSAVKTYVSFVVEQEYPKVMVGARPHEVKVCVWKEFGI